ncbi:MAG: zinc-binding dehydrogenase, partial [Magnetococcales bacterium]|nr:zinc-binding dehydrogenase [Magnetococcales bacterium]
DRFPWMADHKVANMIVLPAAAYVEMALAACREFYDGEFYEVEELEIVVPMIFDASSSLGVRFEIYPRDGGFQIRSRKRLSDGLWILHAVGRVVETATINKPLPAIPLAQNKTLTHLIDRATHYRLAKEVGLQYGPLFQGVSKTEVYSHIARTSFEPPVEIITAMEHYRLHPAVLDLAFQSIIDFFSNEINNFGDTMFLPAKIGRVRYFGGKPVVASITHLKRFSRRVLVADIELLDEDGNLVASIFEYRAQPAPYLPTATTPSCWKIQTRLHPHANEQKSDSFPACQQLAQRLERWFVEQESELQRQRYFKEALPLFEALTTAILRDVFRETMEQKGEWLRQAMEQPMAVDDDCRSLFLWMVAILRQEGVLQEPTPGQWLLDEASLPAAPVIWYSLLQTFPAYLPELSATAHASRRLRQALLKEGQGVDLPAREGGFHGRDILLDDSPAYQGSHLAVEQVVRWIVAQWPENRRLRVLEIGEGLRGGDFNLASLLIPQRIDHVLAHGDPEVHGRLLAEFGQRSQVVVAKLTGEEGGDLTGDAAIPDRFDLIILRHWLHRQAKPEVVLAKLRQKLVRGGLLLLCDRYPDTLADLLFGLDAPWWRQTPTGETTSPLQPPLAWQKMLQEQGYDDIVAFREPASATLAAGGYVILAKQPVEEVVPLPEANNHSWLLLCDQQGASHTLADTLATQLMAQGQQVQGVALPLTTPDWEQGITSAIQQEGKLDHLVYFSPDKERVTVALHLVQALSRLTNVPRLWLLTSGGALTDPLPGQWPISPWQGALWGFGRVVANEYAPLNCTLIDLNLDTSRQENLLRLCQELLQPDGEKEIVLTPQGRHVLRMLPVKPSPTPPQPEPAHRFRLDFSKPGQLRNLIWIPVAEKPLAQGEIEVKVVAVGLNFRDVMFTMGFLTEEAMENGFAGATLGLEFSGIVTRLGPGVSSVAVGDGVMGFAPSCFASHVITQAATVIAKPAEWSFEAAATIPAVFSTVLYALKGLADLQPGEKVLIHGAAGGVGLAAVQFALYLGAEVYATAGSEEKHDFLRMMGVRHIFDSRSLAFAEQILALTNGEGVDVVLNSLSGEAIRRSLGLLKPFGRFLELGKRDFFENTPVGLRYFKNNIK